jgi:putative Holliday junction resolvase
MSLAAEKKHEDRLQEAAGTRILAVDYGRKKIGLALSDELALTARPLAVIVRKNRLEDLKRLREICTQHTVSHVIVGHPIHITGEPSDMAAEAKRFAVRLGKALRLEIELVDERLTSWEARKTVSETKGRAGKRESIDDVAAAVLLRDYLEHRRKTQTQPVERN